MAAFEVLALDTATPQIRAPGASDTYTFPRAVELPLGTANGVLYLNGSKVVTSGTALQFSGNSLNLASSDISMTTNFAVRWGQADIYGDTGFALVFRTNSLLEQMRLNSTGLGIGTAPSYKLDVSVGTNTIAQQWQGASTSFTLRLKTGNGATPSSSVYRLYMDYLNGSNTGGYIDFYRGLAGNDGYLLFGTSGSDRMTLDSSGNLGLGATPSAWNTGAKAIQIKSYTTLFEDSGGATNLAFNAYQSSTGSRYIQNEAASTYSQVSGAHRWFTAASGTAGNTISFTQAMTLFASGGLSIGTTTDPGANRILVPASGSINGNGATGDFGRIELYNSSTGDMTLLTTFNAASIIFQTNGAINRLRIDQNGNIVPGTAAIATNATNGFLYVPTCAGTPTGTPTTYTGRSPIVVDSTNNKLYFYSGGQWRDAGP